MKTELPYQQAVVYRAMRRAGLLQDVDGDRLKPRRGVVAVICGDGDQSHDIFKYLGDICQFYGERRVHPVALNGGPLLIAKNLPLSANLPDGDVLMRHALDGADIKQIDVIIVKGHAPCGAAGKHKADDPEQVVAGILEARQALRAETERRDPDAARGIRIAPCIQISWGEENFRRFRQDEAGYATLMRRQRLWLNTRIEFSLIRHGAKRSYFISPQPEDWDAWMKSDERKKALEVAGTVYASTDSW